MRIQLVPAHNPGPYTGEGNNTYLILGREPALIDAGTGDPRHILALENAMASDRAGLRRILVTHGHVDHASGASALLARWPDAIVAKMAWPESDAQYGIDPFRLADGDLVPAGDDALRAVHTPGHAPDHLCFLEEESRTMFSGDLLVLGSTVLIPATRGGSLTRYLSSLQRVRQLGPKRLLPAHGQAIEDPAALIHEYLEHRRQREQQILSVLEHGRATVDAIVAAIYRGLAPELIGAARESVLAHLIKLEAEQRARPQPDDTWGLI